MDKFFSISKAAYELGIHEDDLFNLASDGVITLSWRLSSPIRLYEIDMSTGEPKYFNDDNPLPCNQPIDVIREGYFEIDLKLCPSWKIPLDNIRCGGGGYGFDFFESLDPLVVKEVGPDGYIWGVTPPPELGISEELDFPTIQTLGVFDKELKRYIAQLKHVESRPKPDGVGRQQEKAYKKYLDKTNQWSRLNDATLIGKKGFKNEVYEALKNERAEDGSYLFASRDNVSPNKKNMKASWEKLKGKYR